MSDIGLNLDGIIALLIFLVGAAVLGVGGILSLIIAFVTAAKRDQSIRKQGAFQYFLVTVPLVFLNLAAFGILLFFVDSNSDGTNQLADSIALYAWLPLQPIIWIAGGFILNKL